LLLDRSQSAHEVVATLTTMCAEKAVRGARALGFSG